MSKKLEMRAIFKGNVHGVFFRDTTRKFAQKLGLTGTVKNVPDGTVEVHAQGDKEKLNQLVERLKTEGPGQVEDVDKDFIEPTKEYEGFEIVY